MGLDMKTKKKLSEETAKRYCTAAKKQKTKILDEFIATTGYNLKYAIHLLKNTAYIKITHFNNVARQSVQVITKTRKKRRYNFGCSQCATSLAVKFSTENLPIMCRFSFHSEMAQCTGFRELIFSQPMHFKEGLKNTTVKTYNNKSSGCGFFQCICVQNGSCRLFGIISITLLKSSAMINN